MAVEPPAWRGFRRYVQCGKEDLWKLSPYCPNCSRVYFRRLAFGVVFLGLAVTLIVAAVPAFVWLLMAITKP